MITTNPPDDYNGPQPSDSTPFTWRDFRRLLLPGIGITADLLEWATRQNLTARRLDHLFVKMKDDLRVLGAKVEKDASLTGSVQEMNATLSEIREAISDLDQGGKNL